MALKSFIVAALFFPMMSFAECNHIIKVPYVEIAPGEVQLAIVPHSEKLKALGVIEWTADEISDNQALVCLVMEDGKSRFSRDEFQAVLSDMGATHVQLTSEMRALYSQPVYRRMRDPRSGDIVFADGQDGRPTRVRRAADPNRAQELRQRGERIRDHRQQEDERERRRTGETPIRTR